mgnify:CR=1 FL=1
MEMTERAQLKDKKRIVIKIGSSSLTHSETGRLWDIRSLLPWPRSRPTPP